MSMEINEKYHPYPADYAWPLKTNQEKTKETEQVQTAGETPDKIYDLQDAYISSQKTDSKPSGLYWIGQDEYGRKKIFFDDPKKAEHADDNQQQDVAMSSSEENEPPKAASNATDKSAEKCIANTDKVDREIAKLKERKKELEQQIRSASEDENKLRELKAKLEQVKSELSQKDNDTYRRQHSTFSE